MLPTLLSSVKSACCSLRPNSHGYKSSGFWKEQRTLWLLFGGGALLLWLTGADTAIAHAIYQPNLALPSGRLAWFLRLYGSLPAAIATLLGLIAIFWPRLWKKRPTLYQTAVVLAFTTILGAGLINQVVVKNLADRARPRETILEGLAPNPIGNTSIGDGFRGNSMPSGHAAMGFVLAAPFFPLRRKRPRLAAASLAIGLSLGTLIGMSRMMLGAHFASDVTVAALISLVTSSALTAFLQRYRFIPAWAVATPAVLGGSLFFAINPIKNLQMTLPLAAPFREIKLPCPVNAVPTPSTTTPVLDVTLHGYGAPASNLKLQNKNGIISIQTHQGVYHHLTCTATLAVPTE